MNSELKAGHVDASNFQSVARKAIETYESKGMIIDAMLWNHIVNLYSAQLDQKDNALFAALSVLSMCNVPNGTTHTAKEAFDLVLAACGNETQLA